MKGEEFISALAERMQWNPAEVRELLSALGSEVASRLIDQDTVCLLPFGNFEAEKKPEYIETDRETGKRLLVPPRLEPVFRADIHQKESREIQEDHE